MNRVIARYGTSTTGARTSRRHRPDWLLGRTLPPARCALRSEPLLGILFGLEQAAQGLVKVDDINLPLRHLLLEYPQFACLVGIEELVERALLSALLARLVDALRQ